LETAISFGCAPPTPAKMSQRILATSTCPFLVVEMDGEVVGYAYAGPTERAPPIVGWLTSPSMPRLVFIGAALAGLSRWGFWIG
jgi:hypothetical protein